jgi:hypothetical protein
MSAFDDEAGEVLNFGFVPVLRHATWIFRLPVSAFASSRYFPPYLLFRRSLVSQAGFLEECAYFTLHGMFTTKSLNPQGPFIRLQGSSSECAVGPNK